MSVNSSFNSSLHLLFYNCSHDIQVIFNFTAFTVANVLLLPLYIFILYLGFHSSAHTPTHSDVFTYNVVVLEMISIAGCFIYCAGIFSHNASVLQVGIGVFFISSPGRTLFHLLTCVDRYLAVIWPVTYLGLRQAVGSRIRNIAIGCAWLISSVLLCAGQMLGRFFSSIAVSCLLIFSLIVILFCNVSVLCALIGPGPGDVGRVDRTKRRAFYSITAIMGALMSRSVGLMVANIMDFVAHTHTTCIMRSMMMWLTLPNSLVLPLLFLHRAGKLPDCNINTPRAEPSR